MQVTINRGETTTGMFKKTTHYEVTVHVTFSDEETAIIKARDLGGVTVMERPVPSDRNPSKYDGIEDVFNLRISTLLDGPNSYCCASPRDAKIYEEELKEQLKLLKNYIMENAEHSSGSETFEL